MRSKRNIREKSNDMLFDDLTKANISLINRLGEHPEIETAWSFIGRIHAKDKYDKPLAFDIFNDINDRLRASRSLHISK